ncbi:MAG: OmpA family protein [Bdellovibrionota bacterium]
MDRKTRLSRIESRIKQMLARDQEYAEERCDDGSDYLITKAVAYFEPEQTRVNTWSAEKIRSFAKLLRTDDRLRLSLTAYASSQARMDCKSLAHKRALEVAAAFVKNGIDPGRISIDTMVVATPGQKEPDALAEQYNRRVEATLWNAKVYPSKERVRS